MPRKYALFGGTGPAGIVLIEAALARGNTVVVYARNPQKLPASLTEDSRVTIVKGDITDEAAIVAALRGVDAVISVLGPVLSQAAGNPTANGYATILRAMVQAGVKRIVATSTVSWRHEKDQWQFLSWLLVNLVAVSYPNAYNDIVAQIPVFTGAPESIEWTVLRVPALNDNPATPAKVGYRGQVRGLGLSLSRATLANCILDCEEQGLWIKEAPLISS